MADGKFKYFVLLAEMRTGSNLFESHINGYDELSCHGELFNPGFVGYPLKDSVVEMDLKTRERDPFLLLRNLVETVTDTLPGFRWFSDHDRRVLDFCLEDEECAKILLTRNPVDSFVSQKIAEQTDQWKMGDLHRRRKAMVQFDVEEFKMYIAKRDANTDHIEKSLQSSGQAAFRLKYEDLNTIDAMNGAAQFIGARKLQKTLSQKMARQNPEPLSQKVSNFDEMMQSIASIDFTSLREESMSGAKYQLDVKQFYCGNVSPMLYFPVGITVRNHVLDWMTGHDSSVANNQNKAVLNDWLKSKNNRSVFSVLDHPVDRAYKAFYDHIFLNGASVFPWIRKNLIQYYDAPLPSDEQMENATRETLIADGYTTEQHAKAFECFLKYLKGNLNGQTRARIDPCWASQFSVLAGLSEWVQPDVIIRPDQLQDSLGFIETKLGLKSITLPEADQPDHMFTLSEIYDAKVEKLTRAAYQIDYNRFGFSDWA
ncbi:hypothetical protein GCM10008927_12080 [Amylibacter ulvae]|uniref:Nodulation protein NodH n=1 Tax=Paramylibacter ulvae TaxID=1651968 RepID=A0ABQ3CYX1_9RHOB|nr:nodulation protein NodH [Amylibacter ulvae]GHA48571.1 hypothetical protein GCM10008927_12080 [Amylibacter ulvae]